MSAAHLFGPPSLDDVRARAATVGVPRPAIQDATARVLAESGSLLLCGPSGSGRSHALRMLVRELAERGRPAVWLHAGSTPFAAVRELLGRPVDDLSTAAGQLGDLLDADDAVLLIDDWPDLDRGSQRVVEHMQRTTRPTILATGPVARTGWRTVQIPPLTGAEVATLLALLLAPVPEALRPARCDTRLVEMALALAGPWPGPVVRYAERLVETGSLTVRDGRPAVLERQMAPLLRTFSIDPPWPLPGLPPRVARLASVIAWAQPIDRATALHLAGARPSDLDELVQVGWIAPARPGPLRFSGPIARRIQRESSPEACAALARHWRVQEPVPWLAIAAVLPGTDDPALLSDLGAAALRALRPVDPLRAQELALACPPPRGDDAEGVACFLDCHAERARSDHERRGPEAALEVIGRVPEELGAGSSARSRFDRLRAQLCWSVGRVREAAVAYESACVAAELPDRARLLHHAGTAFAEIGDLGRAIRCFEAALPAFRDDDQTRSVMAVCRGLCVAYGAVGDRVRAEQAGREALALADALAFDRVGVLVRLDLADAALADGDLDAASALRGDAADAAAGDRGGRADLERRVALLAVLRRDSEGAHLARRAVESATAQEAALECGLAWATLAWAEAQAGEDEARQQASRQALRILREAGAGAELARARLIVAESCLEVSRHAEAADHARFALQFANEFARPPLHAWARRVLQRSQADRGSSVHRLTELATRIALQDSRGDLLSDLAAAAVELMDADRAMVVLVGDDGQLEPVARAGAYAYEAPSTTVVERVIESGREVVATDLGERADLRNASSVVAMNLRAAVGLPLEIDGQVVGALYVDSQDTPTGEIVTTLALLRALAAHASVALRQGRLADAIRRRAAAAERAWRYADDLLRAIPTPIVITDASGAPLDTNRAARRWIAAGDETPVDQRLEPLSGGFADEYMLRTTEGGVPVHVTRSEAIAPDGRTLHLHGLTDLSGRIAAEAQMARAAESARESTAAKSRFLLSMSHELRTPLNAITGYAELLMEDGRVDEVAIGDLGRVVAAADSLRGLIDNVLDISRIEAGRIEIVPQSEDLVQTVEEAAERLRPVALERGIALHCDCDPLGPWLTDHDRVEGILEQLVSNAVEHADASRIDIVARLADGLARIEVRDDGTGIPPHRMRTLFQPFQRLDPAERPGGAGLGLAICYQLAQRLGGILSVTTGERGTCFALQLPAAR